MSAAVAERGARGDLAQLVERLRKAGLRVDTRQYLAAHELLLAFAQRGTDLQADPQAFASHLGPIFCTSVEDQRVFEGEFRSWWGVPPSQPSSSSAVVKDDGRHRWVSTGVLVSVALAIVLAGIFYVFFPPHPDEPVTPSFPDLPTQPEPAQPEQPASRVHVGQPEQIGTGQFATARRNLVASPWLVTIGGGAACGLAVFGVVWALQRRRRAVALKRLPDTGDPDVVTINPPVADFVDLSPAQLLRIATGMRRARAQSSVSLCLEATVEMTARAGGFVSPAFAPRLATSEYLVLIERRGAEDHTHHLAQRWMEQLRGHDVAADCFDFHTDPRVCADAQTLRRYRLADLLARYHSAVVLIHAETATLFDEITGRPQQWLEPLLSMRACVLLTPSPTYRWNHREKALIEAGVIVLPATAAGLQVVASMGNEWRQPNDLGARYARDFPRVITNRDTRWLDRSAPPGEVIATLLQQLSGFLGPVGYLWVCACAVYPQVSWATTLALLPDIVTPGDEVGRRRAIDECLPSLARLPWFRAGYMPDWLRSLLIANLPADKETAVRERLGRLIVDLVRRRDHAAKPMAGALDIAKSLTALDVARAAPEGSPLGDRVFLGFLAGANPDPLTLALPAASRAHGPRQRRFGEKLIGHWRSVTQLRPAMTRAVAAVLVGLLSAGALWKLSPTAAIPVPLAAADVTYAFVAADVVAAISPNGSFLAVGHGANSPGAEVLDLTTSKTVATLVPDERVIALAISPDSRLVGGVDAKGGVHVWDSSGNVRVELRLPEGAATAASVSFNQDGTLMAVGAGTTANIVDVVAKRFSDSYDASRSASGSQVQQQSALTERIPVTGVDFGLQRSLLAIGYEDHLQIADVAGRGTGEQIRFTSAGSAASSVALSADGRFVATVEKAVTSGRVDFRVSAWESNGTSFSQLDPRQPVRGRQLNGLLAWSPRGEMLVHWGTDGRLRLFDPRKGLLDAVFDSKSVPPSLSNSSSLYTVQFTSSARSPDTRYVVKQRSLVIDAPPAATIPVSPPAATTALPPADTAQQRPTSKSPAGLRRPVRPQTNAPASAAPPPSDAAGKAPASNAPASNAPASNAPAANVPARGPITLEKNQFILPADGAPPNAARFPKQFCCEGYVAELREPGGNVMGFLQLRFSNGGSGAFSGGLANSVHVSAHVIRTVTQGGAVDPLYADYDSSDSTLSIDDYLKNNGYRQTNRAGRLLFSVSIAKASVEKGGMSKQDSLRPGAYFDVSSIQVAITVSDLPPASAK